MTQRFDMEQVDDTETGWMVTDLIENAPASFNGRLLMGLTLDEADDMVDLLNTRHRDWISQGKPKS